MIKKMIFLDLMLFAATVLSAQVLGKTTVKEVQQKGMNKDVVILAGKFTDRIDNDEYIFSDGTGTVLVKLDGELEYYARSNNLVNIPLEITGKVERKNNPLKIKVRGRQNLHLTAAQ